MFRSVALRSAVALSFLISSLAFGWGETGHRVVGQIAENHLTDKAKKQVAALIGQESLARASTWADEIRSDPQYDYIKPWHYATLPDSSTYAAAPKEGDVIEAIAKMVQKLKNQKTPHAEKAEALRLIVHFVGDIHMPFHAGNGKDRGASWCMVKFLGHITNLHSLWDSGLIANVNLSYTEYAKFLERSNVPPTTLKSWRQEHDVKVWAKESAEIRNSIYPSPENHEYCKSADEKFVPETQMPQLGYDYAYKFRPIWEKRLLQAGHRLAVLLDDLFDPKK